jgi:hypothetical protein|tara:strand:- start:13131 stop:13868 length:738 start_codon:yes stop_codon:yes gene_type:complete
MPFNPTTPDFEQNFKPDNPTAGGNADGQSYYGCNNNADKDRIQEYWVDLSRQYGLDVLYFRNGYDLEKHDALYGEHTTSKFKDPKSVRALVNVENQNTILSQFGIITDVDIQFYIPIPTFAEVFGDSLVPNRGDLIQIPDEACDRPEDQDAKVYQITNKRDSVEAIDIFAGHHVWFIEAKRFDFSYEDNAPEEDSEQITDSAFVGIMEGGTQEKSKEKTYGPSADDGAKEDLDNTDNSGTYGNYL